MNLLTIKRFHVFAVAVGAAQISGDAETRHPHSWSRAPHDMVILPSGPVLRTSAQVRAHESLGETSDASHLRPTAAERLAHAQARANGEQYVGSVHQLRERPPAVRRHRPPAVRRQRRNATANLGRWCAEAQLSHLDLELMQTPDEVLVEADGYCFYLSRVGQSCKEACDEQMGGECDAAGTEYAAKSVQHCKDIVEGFGGLKSGDGLKSENDRAGCTWSDLADDSNVEVFTEDNLYPLCSETHDAVRSHRICACTAMFGTQGLYTEAVGECKSADGGQNKVRSGTFKSVEECQDECTRDQDCAAFAYVHPWDGNETANGRACNFYSDGHTGDGGNSHIRCSSKESYLATIGQCKRHGGESTQVASSASVSSFEECEAACNADDTCKAFQVPEVFEWGRCALFEGGHTGDGQQSQRCYTKAFGGVRSLSAR